jgi:hypothetical protein
LPEKDYAHNGSGRDVAGVRVGHADSSRLCESAAQDQRSSEGARHQRLRPEIRTWVYLSKHVGYTSKHLATHAREMPHGVPTMSRRKITGSVVLAIQFALACENRRYGGTTRAHHLYRRRGSHRRQLIDHRLGRPSAIPAARPPVESAGLPTGGAAAVGGAAQRAAQRRHWAMQPPAARVRPAVVRQPRCEHTAATGGGTTPRAQPAATRPGGSMQRRVQRQPVQQAGLAAPIAQLGGRPSGGTSGVTGVSTARGSGIWRRAGDALLPSHG